MEMMVALSVAGAAVVLAAGVVSEVGVVRVLSSTLIGD